jgi:hypothetical protein
MQPKNKDKIYINSINKPTLVLSLLNMVIKKSTGNITTVNYCVIRKRNDRDRILLEKRRNTNITWNLPSFQSKKSNWTIDVPSFLKDKYDITVKLDDIKVIKYRNIIYINNKYYYTVPYDITKYDGVINFNMRTNYWGSIPDRNNLYIGDISDDILDTLDMD